MKCPESSRFRPIFSLGYWFRVWILLFLVVARGFCSDSPAIISLDKSGRLQWSSGYTNGIAIIERSTTLQSGSWSRVSYDVPLYSRTSRLDAPYFVDVPTPVRTVRLPACQGPAAFYRIALETNIPDPNLLMHLSFDNDFPWTGLVLDVSGHGNHGLRYGRPGYPTNWPSITTGPDGSQAAEFHYYMDGWGDYGISGDYIGIPTVRDFADMPQATIAFWCHYYRFIDGQCNCNSTPLQAGMGTGAWTFGRYYDVQTTFEVDGAFSPIVVAFPDRAPTGDTGGWHHYAVTFDHGTVLGYFDGTNCDFGVVPNQTLTVAGEYLSIAGWTFNVDPWLNGDGHPNNAWINGALDDIRIYNRMLNASELLSLYSSFDKQAPGVPQNLRLRADCSSQTELRWDESTDNFRVDGYRVRRNGVVVGTTRGRFYVDTGLTEQTAYAYTVQAYDPAGNVSSESSVVRTNTPASASGVEVLVDNADGLPWVDVNGSWSLFSVPNPPNYWDRSFLGGFQTRGATRVAFRPSLPEAGNYQVYIWNPGASDYPMWVFSATIPVDIVHAGVTNTVIVNEQVNYAIWNYLGTYTFAAGTNGFVLIRTDGTSGDVITADAMRFVK